MSPATSYFTVSAIAFIAWLMLMFAPTSPLTKTYVRSGVFSAGFAVVYAIILYYNWGAFVDGGAYFSYKGLVAMLQTPAIFMLAWVHYLAFDLLIGCLEVEDALRNKIPQNVLIPCLFLTYLFGPLGWLCYLLVRYSRTGAALPSA